MSATYYEMNGTRNLEEWRGIYTYAKIPKFSSDIIYQIGEFLECPDGLLSAGIDAYRLSEDWRWFYWYDHIFFRDMSPEGLLMFKMRFG